MLEIDEDTVVRGTGGAEGRMIEAEFVLCEERSRITLCCDYAYQAGRKKADCMLFWDQKGKQQARLAVERRLQISALVGSVG